MIRFEFSRWIEGEKEKKKKKEKKLETERQTTERRERKMLIALLLSSKLFRGLKWLAKFEFKLEHFQHLSLVHMRKRLMNYARPIALFSVAYSLYIIRLW
jgi:hypothetical protein